MIYPWGLMLVEGGAVAAQDYGQAPWLAHRFKTRYPIERLVAAGLSPQGSFGVNHQLAYSVWGSALALNKLLISS
jgi:hypothetical protein